jgi:dTDP-glucose pyrophosphorylase
VQPVAANETLAIVSGVYVFDPEEVLFFKNLKLSFRGDYDVPLLF